MDALGTWDDAAKTDPALRASGISLLKGLLTILGTTSGVALRVNAGNAAPGQTIKTFTAKVGLSNVGTTTTNVYLVTAGKTFYVTDLYISHDGTVALDTQMQANGVTILRAPIKGDTSPLQMAGLESQPSCAGSQQLSILWPLTPVANGYYFVAGFEQ